MLVVVTMVMKKRERADGSWGKTGLQIMVLIPEWPEAQDITYTPYHLDISQ